MNVLNINHTRKSGSYSKFNVMFFLLEFIFLKGKLLYFFEVLLFPYSPRQNKGSRTVGGKACAVGSTGWCPRESSAAGGLWLPRDRPVVRVWPRALVWEGILSRVDLDLVYLSFFLSKYIVTLSCIYLSFPQQM